jgi:phosphotransferase system HPr (HPr) family protein
MIQLTRQNILLRAEALNKEEAIRTAGRVLVEGGYIASGYVESMLGRELQANTYLGNGIAIPHGMGQDRELIKQTGVSVVQFPSGVEWNPGQMVYLVVGIAAKSDEHLGILAALTDVLDDAALAERLAHTNDAAEIISALTRQTVAAPASSTAEELAGAHHVDVQVAEGAGLHARPSTFLVDVATQFDAEIRIQHGARIANAKALASLLKLGVEGGETIRIIASGPDAEAALKALKEAIESGLGETEEKEAPVATLLWQPESNVRAIMGVSASPGIAIGRLFQFQATRIVVTDRPSSDAQAEQRQLEQALEAAREQLAELYDAVAARSGKSEAGIFRAHQALLDDEDLYAEVRALIEGGHSAAWSWQRAIDERVAELQQVNNERSRRVRQTCEMWARESCACSLAAHITARPNCRTSLSF